ncbi:MAG: Fe-S cluster assembly protein SufD [Gemmatimonadota bacterium]
MVRTTTPDVREWYRASQERFERHLNGEGEAARALRRAALERLAAAGFPTARDEGWRHTNPAPLVHTEFHAVLESRSGTVTPADLRPWSLAGLGLTELVFVDGLHAPELSSPAPLPAGVRAESLAAALRSTAGQVLDHLARRVPGEGGFAALNTAFLRDGGFIEVAPRAAMERPVHLLYLTSGGGAPSVSHPRTLVVVGDGARASVVETHAGLPGSGTYLSNAVTEIAAGAGSVVEHLKVHREGDAAYHVGQVGVVEQSHCAFTSHNLTLSGRLVRNDIATLLDGEGIESTLNGLYLATGEEQVDNYTTIEHARPHCSSHELYKGILTGRARGVFRGKIHVHQAAQKTDAYQSNQNLLLSDEAEVTSKPQLEIYADDVKCSHGSTTGRLDRDAIFYLRARGISRPDAVRVLTQAFADELVDRIGCEEVRRHLAPLVHAKLDPELIGRDPA